MKKLSVSLMAIFLVLQLCAQENNDESFPKHIISFHGGIAIPSDELSNANQSDLNATSAASATSGVTAGFDYQHNVSKYIGINVLLRAYVFPVDENTTLNDFQNDPVAVYMLNSEPFALGMVGFGFTAQYGGLVQGYISPFIGYGGMRSPEIEVQETVGVNYESLTRDFSSDLNIMYGADFGVRIKLAKVLLLGINAEYLTAPDFEFNGDVSVQQNNDPKQVSSYEYKQAFSTFSLALKVGFTF